MIIATPNFTHKSIAIAAAKGKKHMMCEKPLGLNAGEVREMYEACRDNDVVHMTAFTYRFAPSMLYMKHLLKSGLLGEPRHFRSQRFFDMTIHRIDFAIDLLGPIKHVCGAVARFAPRTTTPDGKPVPPSDVDDWSCLLGEFESGATGIWEGTTLAKGYKRNGFGHEWAEINGSEGSAVYRLHEPNTILVGTTGQDLSPVVVPDEFLKPKGSPRDPKQGEPATVFRYDLMWEFISAIVEKRQAVPSFWDGLNAQLVADATLKAYEQKTWIPTPLAAH